MANISGLLGTAGGFKGTGVDAPDETQFVNGRQTNDAYNNVQASMEQQKAFLAALNGQNALGNQGQVYGQLQGVVNGQGPNPAMAMLNQATGNNIANQGAMMAGQRGASGNVGMMARLAAQQGANTQQQAIGQGASLQAQQGLNALTSAGNMANTQVSNLMGQINQNVQSQQGTQANLLGGALHGQQAMNSNRTALIGGTAQQQAAVGGGAMSGAGAALAMAGGGEVSPAIVAPMAAPQAMSTNGPQSMLGKSLAGMGSSMSSQDPLTQGMTDLGKGIGTYVSNHRSQPSMPTTQGPMMAGGAGDMPSGDVMAASKGGPVPGTPKVNRDSYANDTVPAKLSPGEIVLPLHITQSPNAPEMAAQFVRDTLAKKMAGGGMAGNYAGGGMAPIDMEKEQARDANFKNNVMAIPSAIRSLWHSDGPDPLAPANQQAQTDPMPAPQPTNAPMSQMSPEQQSAPTNFKLDTQPQGQSNAGALPANYNPNQGLQTQMAGVQQQQKAETNIAADQTKALQDNQDQLRDMQYQISQNAWNHQVEQENAVNDMKNGMIDPNHYMNTKSTGSKISTAIGLILGGIGGGLTGQGNSAERYIHQQIQNDIAAQEKNMGQKNNILGALEKQYGDKTSALKSLENIYLMRTSNAIQEAATKNGGDMAKARAQQALGPIQQQIQSNNLELGLRKFAMDKANSGGDMSAVIPYLVTDKSKVEDASKAYGAIKSLNDQQGHALQSFDHINKLFMNGLMSPNDTQSAKQAFIGTLQVALEHRYNAEAAAALGNALYPKATDTDQTVKNKRQRLVQEFEGARNEHAAVLSGLTRGLVGAPKAPPTFNRK